MAEEDNSWVFDSLVCFLHGPIWNAPLQNFIEDKSIIFDPNIPMDVKNPDFLKLHSEYKNLVDFMLGSFMQELQISPAKFEMACLEGRAQQQQQQVEGIHNPRAFHQRLFQQIWAANDIRIFVRMMTQRNVELQLQALDLIERRQASVGTSHSGEEGGEDGEKAEEGAASGEKKVLETPGEGKEDEDLIEFNEQGGDDALIEPNAEDLIDSLKIAEEADDEVGVKDPIRTQEEEGEKAEEVPESVMEPKKTVTDRFERLNLFFEREKVDEEEVKQRQDYLRAQRDKILEIKKRTRARQLNETVKATKRPTSARAAQKILEGEEPETLAGGGGHQESSLALRRVLAKRLRDEVVDGQRKEYET